MWFKTRQGMVSLLEPFEIGVTKYTAPQHTSERPINHYSVWIQNFTSQFHYKGFFGTASADDKRYFHVAKFQIDNSSDAAIVHCLTLIEETIAAKAQICDLGAMGDEIGWVGAQAKWRTERYLIKWNQQRR